MDVELFSKILKELLLSNDNVALPGLGSFALKKVPSTFSDKGYTINPPYRTLGFRAEQTSDSLLCDFYARSNNVAPQVAGKVIDAFVKELRSALEGEGEVYFPQLGRLRKGRSGLLFFTPDEDLELNPLGFSLESVSLKARRFKGIAEKVGNDAVPDGIAEQVRNDAVADEIAEQVRNDALADEVAEQVRNDALAHKSLKRFWIAVIVIIAVVALVVGAFYILKIYFPDILDLILYNKEELELLDYFN